MQNIIVIGGGGHAKVVIDLIEKQQRYGLTGIVDAHLPVGTSILGYDVLGNDNKLAEIVREHDVWGAVLGLGDNYLRSQVVESLRAAVPALQFPNIIHPRAVIAKDVRFGQGTVVMAGCVINSSSVIGDFCVLNTNCSLDHDGRLGDYASLAPGTCAGGNVDIGEYTAIGLGAQVVHKVNIGAGSVVGAGATVLGDLPANVVAYGTPAKPVRTRQAGETYL